jgi:hypothetical protein
MEGVQMDEHHAVRLIELSKSEAKPGLEQQ